MTNYSNDIRSLLSLAFEVEGLLMLAERRDDMTPAEVLDMLADKCAALLDGVASLRDTSQSQTVTSPSPAIPSPATAGADDEALAEAARFEEVSDACPCGERSCSPAIPAPATEDGGFSEAPETAAVPKKTASPAPPAAKPVKLTLNDRFRFRRTLFGDSDERMNDTLSILSSLGDSTDREDYIVNDLCWNPDDQEVADFLSVIDAQR